MKNKIAIISLVLLTATNSSQCMLSRSLRRLSHARHGLQKIAKTRLNAIKKRNFHSSHARQFDSLKFFRIVKHQERAVIERLGKYNRTLDSGLHFTIPIIESSRKVYWSGIIEDNRGRLVPGMYSTRRIDLRERVYDLPSQRVITKDNVGMKINGIVYYEILDPYKAVYKIQDLPRAIEKLSQTTLRNIIGSMHLDETLTSRDEINKELCDALGDKGTKEWGIQITRVELQEIDPPKDIERAMEKQMSAERDARALKLTADGEKQAAILRAEGDQRSSILKAEGDKQARVLRAEGKAQERLRTTQAEEKAIAMITQAIPEGKGNPVQYMIAMQYLQTMPKITKGKGKVIVPAELSAMAGVLGSINTVLGSTKTPK